MDTRWVLVVLTVLLLIKTTTSSANEIWISQIGDNLDLEITQQGENNGGGIAIVGDDNTITQTQIGVNNTVGPINSNDTVVGDRNILTWFQDGQYHQFEGALTGSDNKLDSYQGGSGESNFARVMVDGDGNDVTIYQGKKVDGTTDTTEGGDHEAYITITGDSNTFESYQTDESTFCCSNRNHLADIITGSSNTVVHDQRGNGAHQGFIEVTGDSNDIDVLQSGGQGDHFYDLILSGDNNSVTSLQKGDGGHSMTLDLTNNGGAYNVNTTQDSTTNQSYSLTGICTNIIGCAISVTQN